MSSTAQSCNISNPSDLLHLATKKYENSSSRPSEIRLELLTPLCSATTLATCRENSRSRLSYFKASDQTDELQGASQEILDLSPLFKSWRSACSSFPFDLSNPQKFVFDINIPDALHVIWGHAEGPRPCIIEQEVSRFVQGIATVMRIKSKGMAKFALSGAVEYRSAMQSNSPRRIGYFRDLEEVLQKLS